MHSLVCKLSYLQSLQSPQSQSCAHPPDDLTPTSHIPTMHTDPSPQSSSASQLSPSEELELSLPLSLGVSSLLSEPVSDVFVSLVLLLSMPVQSISSLVIPIFANVSEPTNTSLT